MPVKATDYQYAARVFASLHAAGGSSSAKFGRNEATVIALAERHGDGQFTVADLQRWTRWQYQKARRIVCGCEAQGPRYPGLMDIFQNTD